MGRTETVEYRRFRVIEIWELQDDLAAGRLLVPFVHTSGLHAADMHKLELESHSGLKKCVGDLAPIHHCKASSEPPTFGDKKCVFGYQSGFATLFSPA
jgi:hypothetical protein